MRVTTAATYRKYTDSVNSVHSKLNKSMNKITSGKAYERAAENPLAYFEGKKIDTQYQDINTKIDLIADVKNRLYQQEQGALSIQSLLSQSKIKVQASINATNTADATIKTYHDDLSQKLQSMITDLNGQYQDMYVYGGNDLTTTPFEFDSTTMTLTYNHTYPENPNEVVSLTFELQYDQTNGYSYKLGGSNANGPLDPADAEKYLVKAMSEQGLMDLGYGDINDTSSLINTYTGGLNLLTGMSSDYIKANASDPDLVKNILGELTNSAIGLTSQAVDTMQSYLDGTGKIAQNNGKIDIGLYSSSLSDVMGKMDLAEGRISTVYTTLGNRYALLENTETKLEAMSDTLEEIYQDKLGADPYEAITEMYSYQYAYSASLQLGSSIMSMSLFDFMS